MTFAPLDDLSDAVDVDIGAVGCEAARDRTTGCDVADLGAAFGAALVLRDDGTVLAVRAGSAPDVVVDLGARPGIAAALGDGPYQGLIVATGSTALVALAAPPLTGGVPARLLRLSLRVAPSGDVSADVEDDVALPDLHEPMSLGIHGGTAWLATKPLGLLTFDRTAALTLVAGSAAPDVGTDPLGQTFASGLVLVGASTTPLVAARVGGVGDRLGSFDDAAFVARPAITPPAINDVRRAGRFVVATTLDGGGWLLDPADAGGTIAAVLSLPSTTNAQEGAATARGLVFADGAGGVLRVLLR